MNSSEEGPRYIGTNCTDEILRPTLLWFNGGCYRLVKDSFGKTPQQEDDEPEQVEEAAPQDVGTRHHGNMQRSRPYFQDDTYDEGEDPSSQLEGLERTPGGCRLALPTPSVFFKYIIGARGATRENIETDTKCRLRIPRRGEAGNVVIEGPTVSAVAHAKRRVEMVSWNNRFKEDPTHFISIPLTSIVVRERFSQFKEQVLSTCGHSQGICPDVFKEPEKLHLTLGVLRIFSQMEEEKAVKILQEVLNNAKRKLRSEKVTISLKGLDSMGDDVSAARVVYAKVNSSSRLQEFVDELCDGVIKAAPELMRREFERKGVKLHATLINSKFLDKGQEMEVYKGMRRSKTGTVDATALFKSYGDFDFGAIPLTCIHLSKRTEVDARTGYYRCIQEYHL